jgi:hypothetical protein
MSETQPTLPSQDAAVSTRLFVVVCLIVLFVAALLIGGLVVQWKAYSDGIQAASPKTTNGIVTDADHAAIIGYARGLGAAVNKTSSLFLGFMLVFTGALYVLRNASVAYSLKTDTGKINGALETTSPGLVIITLGIVLTIVSLMTKSDLSYEGRTFVAPQGGVNQQGEPVNPLPSSSQEKVDSHCGGGTSSNSCNLNGKTK